MSVPPRRINEIAHDTRAVTAEAAEASGTQAVLRDTRKRCTVDRLPPAPRRGVPGPLGLGAAAAVAVAVNRDRG